MPNEGTIFWCRIDLEDMPPVTQVDSLPDSMGDHCVLAGRIHEQTISASSAGPLLRISAGQILMVPRHPAGGIALHKEDSFHSFLGMHCKVLHHFWNQIKMTSSMNEGTSFQTSNVTPSKELCPIYTPKIPKNSSHK